MKVCIKVMPFFFIRHYNYNGIYIYDGYILYKVEIIFPQKYPSLLTHFFYLRSKEFYMTGICQLHKLFAERLVLKCMQCCNASSSQNIICRVELSRGLNNGSQKVRTVGRMRENKFKVQTSTGEVTTHVFWDSEGILLVEFFKRSATIQSIICRH
jgi:hypothetical protein